jgi:hypothetical protein
MLENLHLLINTLTKQTNLVVVGAVQFDPFNSQAMWNSQIAHDYLFKVPLGENKADEKLIEYATKSQIKSLIILTKDYGLINKLLALKQYTNFLILHPETGLITLIGETLPIKQTRKKRSKDRLTKLDWSHEESVC